MIDWAAFLVVAITSLAAAALVVTSYALGLRLITKRGGKRWVTRTAGSACFVVSAVSVLFGIYLVIPMLH